jgi:serine protease AprX
MKTRIIAVMFFIGMTVASVYSNDVLSRGKQGGSPEKIDRWVIEQTALQGKAEFLVILSDQADLSAADRLRTKEEKGWYVYRTLFDKAKQTQKPIIAWLKSNGVEFRSFYIVNMIWVNGTMDVALSLAARPDVKRIDGNPIIQNNLPQPSPVQEIETPSTPDAIEQGIIYSKADKVWQIGFTGQGIVVGDADTGFQWDHPALKPHYRGWNGSVANHDYNWHDSIHMELGTNGTNPCGYNSTVPCPDQAHGTHTIGTAVGSDGGTNQIGMAPGAKWIGCRNMEEGIGRPSTYLECFQFFLAPYPVGGTTAQGDPTKAPDVTTNSWGCPLGPPPGGETCMTDSLQAGIEAQRAAGIVTVVAAGNSGSGCSTVSDPPSFYAASFTVGALNNGTPNDPPTIASFSSRGPATADGSNRIKPDITAPGTLVRSSVPTNSYQFLQGTSMATPHVAGAIALMLSAQPSLRGKVDIIEGILKDSAIHVSTTLCSSSGWPNNVFGYGQLNAEAATNMALTTFSPQSAAFTSTGIEGTLQVSAPTGVSWTATTTDSWITLVNETGTGNGVVDFIVRDNSTPSVRIGKITVAHRDFTIRQAPAGQSTCTYAFNPTFQTFPPGGGSATVSVAAGEDCVWAAMANVPWITFTTDNGGIGAGSIMFVVAANPGPTARKAQIKINRTIFSVKQK